MDFHMIVLRKSFNSRWSAGRSSWVHEVNPGRDPSHRVPKVIVYLSFDTKL